MEKTAEFIHENYKWNKEKAQSLANDEVGLFLYRSHLLGSDLRITNYAGGNTSVKLSQTDPVTGLPTDLMWVKGSGGDIGTLTKAGCAVLYADKIQALKTDTKVWLRKMKWLVF